MGSGDLFNAIGFDNDTSFSYGLNNINRLYFGLYFTSEENLGIASLGVMNHNKLFIGLFFFHGDGVLNHIF
jgi:hypothetical protein